MKDNKLIAEFMGLHDEISLDSIAGNIHSWSDSPFFYITEDSKEKVIEGITEYSKYHTSWDWLMPVVIKIGHTGKYGGNIIKAMKDLRKYSEVSTLEDTHQAVVEFIQEYRLTPKEVV